MRRLGRIVLALAFVLAGGTAVGAHAFLERAEPRVGSTVHQPPREVRLWFSEALEPAFSVAEVRDAAEQPVTTGPATADATDRKQLRVPMATLSAGTYKVIWRVVSVDTHVTEGNFTFRVAP